MSCGNLSMRTAQARQGKGTSLTVRNSCVRLGKQHGQDEEPPEKLWREVKVEMEAEASCGNYKE